MKIIEGTIASPKGFTADGVHAGFKKEKLDFGWIVSNVPASVAGVYTTNQVIAAPLLVTKQSIATKQQMQAIVVNSGVANSCTGQKGYEDALFMQEASANQLGIEKDLVGIASTGVIGEFLPLQTVASGLKQLDLDGHAEQFAQAILTTDTGTKTITVQEQIFGSTVTMSGVAKGSGMIHPNMATMLAFITCDATISSSLLQKALSEEVETSFNQITVDGDTSTNDMVLVLSNGCATSAEIQEGSQEYAQFVSMLHLVMTELAKMIAKDGEGATKLIQVDVTGATTPLAARMVAKSIVGSSLVKTAIFGEDANWGRIIAAIGYAGVEIDPTAIDIELCGIPVMADSSPLSFDSQQMQEVLKGSTIDIQVHLKMGSASGRAWGCDLSYDYVKINALYRT
ncbi:TPA: bifunctional glutamate N-acetyltransferase/amino-acid acetyltransferase ArgJ [Streptococcus suis]